jgi:hypothetical protein
MIRRTLGLFVTLARSVLWWSLTAAAPPGTMPRIGVRALASPSTSPEWKTRALVVQALRTRGRAWRSRQGRPCGARRTDQ